MKMLTTILLMLALLLLAGCPDLAAPTHQADFFECGEPPDVVLFTCAVGSGPPRADCTNVGSGSTTTAPITC